MTFAEYKKLLDNDEVIIFINGKPLPSLLRNRQFSSLLSKKDIFTFKKFLYSSYLLAIFAISNITNIISVSWFYSFAALMMAPFFYLKYLDSVVVTIEKKLPESKQLFTMLDSLGLVRYVFKSHIPMSAEQASHITREYGKVLKEPSTAFVKHNEDILPYPKQKIKEAIELLLTIEQDEQQINLLKGGLVFLSDFTK